MRAPNPASLPMLLVLNSRQKNIYAGTASPYKVAARRAKNKLARRSRRINRSRG